MEGAFLIFFSVIIGGFLALFLYTYTPVKKETTTKIQHTTHPTTTKKKHPTTHPTQRVRIVSYNVLSSGFACGMVAESPVALKNGPRLNLLRSKLNTNVNKLSIFALQEVSMPWVGALTLFFSQRNYAVVSTPYGSPHSEFMGVMIAYPRDKFIAERAAVELLTAEKPVLKARGGGSSLSGSWSAVRARENQVVSLLLRPLGGGRPFSVTSVHLPCEFWDRCAMRIYAALAAHSARSFARGNPFILAGDFNSTPDSSAYETIVTGTSNRDTPPPEVPGDKWEPCVYPPLRSAYCQALGGKEPLFTTASLAKRDLEKGKSAFVGTLDYIFHSSEWACKSVGSLPTVPTMLPTIKEPSDHHELSADLELN